MLIPSFEVLKQIRMELDSTDIDQTYVKGLICLIVLQIHPISNQKKQ